MSVPYARQSVERSAPRQRANDAKRQPSVHARRRLNRLREKEPHAKIDALKKSSSAWSEPNAKRCVCKKGVRGRPRRKRNGVTRRGRRNDCGKRLWRSGNGSARLSNKSAPPGRGQNARE